MNEKANKLSRNEKFKYQEFGRKIGEELVRAKAGSQLKLAVILLFVVGVYLLLDKNPDNDFFAFLILIFGLILFAMGK